MSRKHLFLLSGLALAACHSSAQLRVVLGTADLDGIAAIHDQLQGIDLVDADGNLHAFDVHLDDGLDLRDLDDGRTQVVVDGADIHSGQYTGIRLRFTDSGNYVERADGSTVPMTQDPDDAFTPVDLDIGSSGTTSVSATLDLRFSLQQTATGFYALVPVLRAVNSDDASSISGHVPADEVESASCLQSRAAGVGAAVYLYAGTIDDPVDYFRGHSSPYASGPLRDAGSQYAFDLPDLPAGTYTVAWTCDGDRDDPASRDTLTFMDLKVVTVGSGDAALVDF